MEIKDIIKNRRAELQLTLEDIARIVGVSKQTVQRWETGNIEHMRTDKVKKLAAALDATPAYIMGWVDDPHATVRDLDMEEVATFSEIGVIRAGYGGTAIEEKTGRTIEIPTSMLNGHKKSDYFCLRVSGSSMYPKLIDGDTILCLRTECVDSGSLAVVLYNGDEATVKKVVYNEGEAWIELVPANPEYQPKRIEGADLAQCRILGKVVKLIRDL